MNFVNACVVCCVKQFFGQFSLNTVERITCGAVSSYIESLATVRSVCIERNVERVIALVVCVYLYSYIYRFS